jgi:hypothetical protein
LTLFFTIFRTGVFWEYIEIFSRESGIIVFFRFGGRKNRPKTNKRSKKKYFIKKRWKKRHLNPLFGSSRNLENAMSISRHTQIKFGLENSPGKKISWKFYFYMQNIF